MRLQTQYASCKENEVMLLRSSLWVVMLSQALCHWATTTSQQPNISIYTVKQSCSQHRFRIRQTEKLYNSISFCCTCMCVCSKQSWVRFLVTAKHVYFFYSVLLKKKSQWKRENTSNYYTPLNELIVWIPFFPESLRVQYNNVIYSNSSRKQILYGLARKQVWFD